MKQVSIWLCAFVLLTAFTNGGRPLSTTLTGAEEPAGGDPDGSGYFEMTLNQGQGTITYELTVEDVDVPRAAHIHYAPAGQAGDVVVGLAAPVGGMSSGVITNVSKELIKAIRQNPEHYYVNVHNAAYPAGAVRGQLSK